jgi:hypothetical protein
VKIKREFRIHLKIDNPEVIFNLNSCGDTFYFPEHEATTIKLYFPLPITINKRKNPSSG